MIEPANEEEADRVGELTNSAGDITDKKENASRKTGIMKHQQCRLYHSANRNHMTLQ